jgi:hypothetical protein
MRHKKRTMKDKQRRGSSHSNREHRCRAQRAGRANFIFRPSSLIGSACFDRVTYRGGG